MNRILAFLIGIALCTPALAGQKGVDELLAQCNKKVTVMGRDASGKLIKAGERLDGYCEGYLEGSFAALLRAKLICFKDTGEPPSAEFLLSLVRTYRADTLDRTTRLARSRQRSSVRIPARGHEPPLTLG